jgi:hypothetical protein
MEGVMSQSADSRLHSQAGSGLGRREFLVLSAAGILTPWLGRAAEAAVPLSGSAAIVAPPVPMSIGYVEGSDVWKSLRRLPWDDVQAAYAAAAAGVEPSRSQVISATDMPLGDQKLASTVVKVTVHGFYGGAIKKRETLDAIDFDVYFPSPDPAFPKPLPFHAWSFRRLPAPNVGHRLSFNVPLDLDGGLALSLIVGQLGASLRQRYTTNFTVDANSGRPKLQRGIYLLGLGPAVWKSEATLPAYGETARPDLRSLVISIDDRPKQPRRKKAPAPQAAPVR